MDEHTDTKGKGEVPAAIDTEQFCVQPVAAREAEYAENAPAGSEYDHHHHHST